MRADRLVLSPSGPFYESCERCNAAPMNRGGLPFSRPILWDRERDWEIVAKFQGGTIVYYQNDRPRTAYCDCELGKWLLMDKDGKGKFYDSLVGSNPTDSTTWNIYHDFERRLSEEGLARHRTAEPTEADRYMRTALDNSIGSDKVREYGHRLREAFIARAREQGLHAEELWNTIQLYCSSQLFDLYAADVGEPNRALKRSKPYMLMPGIATLTEAVA